jgi:hypothetical protein
MLSGGGMSSLGGGGLITATDLVGYLRGDGAAVGARQISGVVPAVGGDDRYDFYPQPGADNGPALRALIDTLFAQYGTTGVAVRLAPGYYQFDTPVGEVPDGFWIIGAAPYAARHVVAGSLYLRGTGPVSAGNFPGTVFGLRSGTGAGSATGTPFLTFHNNGGVRGLSFYHPDQALDAATPTAYPWVIKLAEGNNCGVFDCEFQNAYQAIWSEWQAKFHVARVFGQALLKGVRVEGCWDVSVVDHVFWDVGWGTGGNGTSTAWTLNNATAFELGRCDAITVRDGGCYSYKYGVDLYDDSSHSDGGPTACWGQLRGLTLDICSAAGFRIAQTQANPLKISDCNITCTSVGSWPVDILSTHSGKLAISNCSMYMNDATSVGGRAVRVKGSGTVLIVNCQMTGDLGSGQASIPAVTADVIDASTSFTGALSVGGNQFRGAPGSVSHVKLNASISKALVGGNLCLGGAFTLNNNGATPTTFGNA